LNITRNDIDELSALLKCELLVTDYLPNVETALKKIRKQAQMKGFRPGMVPISLIKQMHGTQVMVDEVNKLLSDEITNYLKEKEIRIIGSPLPADNKPLDFSIKKPKDFEFNYEIGIEPVFDINYKENTFTKYDIAASDDFIAEELERLRKRFGVESEVAPPIEDKDILKVRLEELHEDGLIKEDGATNETFIAVDLLKTKTLQKKVMKLKLNESLDINLKKAFDRTIPELKKFLLDKVGADAELIGLDYKMTILGIKRVALANLEPAFYEQVYRDPTIDTEEKFMERFKADFDQLSNDRASHQLKLEIRDYLMDNTAMNFPEDFLKKLIKANSKEEEATDELLEEQFASFLEGLKWQLITKKIMRENEVKVEEEDLLAHAIVDIKNTYKQYMQVDLDDEQAKVYAGGMLKDQKYIDESYPKILETKLFDSLLKNVKTKPKSISFKDFAKLN